MVVRYDTRNILSLLRLQGSPLRGIRTQLLLSVVVSGVAVLLKAYVPAYAGDKAMDDLEAVSYILTPVAFLLVFRANNALELFWSGRSAVGTLVGSALNLARMTAGYLDEIEFECACDTPLCRVFGTILRPEPGARLLRGERWAGRREYIGDGGRFFWDCDEDAQECVRLSVVVAPHAEHFAVVHPVACTLPCRFEAAAALPRDPGKGRRRSSLAGDRDAADQLLKFWGLEIEGSRIDALLDPEIAQIPGMQEPAAAGREYHRGRRRSLRRPSLPREQDAQADPRWLLCSVGARLLQPNGAAYAWEEEEWTPEAVRVLSRAREQRADIRVTMTKPDPVGYANAPERLLRAALQNGARSALGTAVGRVDDQWILQEGSLVLSPPKQPATPTATRRGSVSAVPPPPRGRVVWNRHWEWEQRVVRGCGDRLLPGAGWMELSQRPVAAPFTAPDGSPALLEHPDGASSCLRRTIVRLINLFVVLAVDELQHSGSLARAVQPNASEPAAPGPEGVLLRWATPDEAQAIHATSRRPGAPTSAVAHWLSYCIAAASRGAGVDQDVGLAMEAHVTTMLDAVWAAVSTRRVPVPFPYVQMLNLGLLMLIVMSPFTLVFDFGPATLLICPLSAVAFLGVNHVGGEITDPFGDDPNDLCLNATMDTLQVQTVGILLQREAALCPGGAEGLLRELRGPDGGTSPAPSFWEAVRALEEPRARASGRTVPWQPTCADPPDLG
eukprot:TRINITY_DN4065_c0_g1_i1.p1 TRINITY_DN4065_c0_g1~~TRINITY_DN4065_c0_g1_i1.p1  ORF type:complete len:728 (+),score=97.65 TRINITY_DN4065_c0_g1_i1:113-2296(+)